MKNQGEDGVWSKETSKEHNRSEEGEGGQNLSLWSRKKIDFETHPALLKF